MPHIFISYRRSESAYAAHAIYDRLASRYGERSVVFDVDSIPIGADFVDYVQQEVSRCDVLLVIIGEKWLDVRSEDGHRRLDDPDDHVRTEIQAALDRDIPVIPVLVGEATMPKQSDLPEGIGVMARRNAISVRPGRGFQSELETLERGLRSWFEQLDVGKQREFERSFIIRNWVATMATLIAAGVFGSALLSAVSIPFNNAVIHGVPQDQSGLLNFCMYGVAIIAGIYGSLGMCLTISRYRPGDHLDDYDARRFARSALGLPFHIPLFVLLLWVSSGFVIPAFLKIADKNIGDVTTADVSNEKEIITSHHFVQFLIVQSLLGPMAAAITFYLLAEVTLRFIYPAYAMNTGPDAERQLTALERLVPIATAILWGLPIPTFMAMIAAAVWLSGMQASNAWQMWWLAIPAMLLTMLVSSEIAGRRLPKLRERILQLQYDAG